MRAWTLALLLAIAGTSIAATLSGAPTIAWMSVDAGGRTTVSLEPPASDAVAADCGGTAPVQAECHRISFYRTDLSTPPVYAATACYLPQAGAFCYLGQVRTSTIDQRGLTYELRCNIAPVALGPENPSCSYPQPAGNLPQGRFNLDCNSLAYPPVPDVRIPYPNGQGGYDGVHPSVGSWGCSVTWGG